jgi:hypothetical protein
LVVEKYIPYPPNEDKFAAASDAKPTLNAEDPDAVAAKDILAPLQPEAGVAVAVIVGDGITVTVTVLDAVHPEAFVPATV